jgi:hypothetical protein
MSGGLNRIAIANVNTSLPGVRVFNTSLLGQVWTYDTGAAVRGVFVHPIDGTEYVYACGDRVGGKNMWKLDFSGNLVASFDVGTGSIHGVAVDGDKFIYAVEAGLPGKVWKLNQDGDVLWSDTAGSGTINYIDVA